MTFEGAIPGWVLPHLDSAKIKRLEATIAQAERKTSGEIVPLVVRSSSAVGHVPIIIFCACLIAMLVFQLDHFQKIYIYNSAYWPFANVLLAALLSYIVSKFEFAQRLLVSEEDRIAQVKLRAELEFYRLGITATKRSTGVLIFVSLLEHRVEVLADKKIADLLPPETWNGVVEQVLTGIKNGDLAQGLCHAIDTCGGILGENFPITHDDKNELKDHIIFKI